VPSWRGRDSRDVSHSRRQVDAGLQELAHGRSAGLGRQRPTAALVSDYWLSASLYRNGPRELERMARLLLFPAHVE
jgi:hypothetical protein